VNATAEDAIHDWVRLASGLAAEKIVWEGRHPYPTGTWILMRVDAGGGFGRPWVDRAAAADDNVQYTARWLRRATLQLQCIAGAEGGEASCIAVLEQVIGKRYLPSFAEPLKLAGVGILAEGAVEWRQASRGSVFEPRAVVDIFLTLPSEVSELGPAIKHVEVEGNVGFGDETTWVPDAPVET